MPAAAPDVGPLVLERVARLGERLRAHRKAQGVSITAAAEAAAMSRATWIRLERGEASVGLGAFVAACAAVGLDVVVVDPTKKPESSSELPAQIELSRYPQLARLAWQVGTATMVTPQEALSLYERNWRHVDQAALSDDERAFVAKLGAVLGGGRLLV